MKRIGWDGIKGIIIHDTDMCRFGFTCINTAHTTMNGDYNGRY